MPHMIEDGRSMKDAMSARVLQHIDAVFFLCDNISESKQIFPLFRKWELFRELDLFRDMLKDLQWAVEKSSTGTVNKARFSTYERLFSICLGELVDSERTLALLLKTINTPSDGKNVASLDGSILEESESELPIQALPVPFEAISPFVWRIRRQGASLCLFQDVHSLIEADSEIMFCSVLKSALDEGHEELVRLMIDTFTQYRIPDEHTLFAALFTIHVDFVKSLLAQEADVNTQDKYCGNALRHASFSGREDIVKFLIDHNVDVNIQGGYYGNALQAASFAGYTAIVDFLISKKADINAQGGHYGNALQAASFAGHQKIVRLLLEQGADVNAKGLHGTALQAALSNDQKEIVQLLIKFGLNDGIQDANRDRLVEQIAVWLLENDFFRSLLAKAFEEEINIELFVDRLAQLIQRFGKDLVELTYKPKLMSAARCLFSHSSHIIIMMFSLWISLESDEYKGAAKGQYDRVAAFLNNSAVMTTYIPDEIKLKLSKTDLDEIKQYRSFKIAPLDSFLGSVCRLVSSDPLEAVKAELIRGLGSPSEPFRVRFDLSWRIEEYLDEEIVRSREGEIDRRIVGSLLTLSGDARKCYANSCEAYMKWRWPYTYNILLEALALGSKGGILDTPRVPESIFFWPGKELATGDTIIACGTQEFLIEIAQQLSWLTASIRMPIDDRVSFSDSLLISNNAGTDVARYKILPLPLGPVPETDNSCWLSLFLGTVIARNYPIPEREHERGLELPYDLMAAVAGNVVPKCRDGGIYLKGYSRLLYPVSGSIPGSIQWHLLTSSSRRVSLPDDLICAQSWMRMLDRRLLSSVPRTFLGYCREVIIDLGTNKTADHYTGITFSGAKDAIQGLQVQAPSLTWGTSGMGIFGATLTHSIVYGRALAQTVAGKNDDYLDVLDHALRTPIILYDDGSHRGWMITALIVILHMIRTWAANKNCFQTGLPFIKTPLQDENVARSILECRWNDIVRQSSHEDMCKSKTVKDLVMEFWQGLQKRYEEDLFARHQLAPGVELTSSKLHGWDYMDLVTGRLSCKKQLDFRGNWMDLAEEVTVLFGGGFGDVIQPAPGISICAEWNPIPPDKMYLTATIDCIRKLSCVRGHPSNLMSSKLTNKSYWNYHHASNLFTDCTNCHSSTSTQPVRCPKVLQTLDSSAQKSSQGLLIPSKGAIVFGKQPKTMPLWSLSKKKFSKIPSRIKPLVHKHRIDEPVTQHTVARKRVHVSENQNSANANEGEIEFCH